MRKVLLVEGMSCGHCEKAVKGAVGGLSEVSSVEVDLSTKKVTVEGENLQEASLVEAIEDAGYDVVEVN